MKPRFRKTYPILAVAVTAAACARSTSGGEGGHAERPLPAAAPKPPEVAVPREDPGTVSWAAYRPPVDGDGYPLVGNLVRKGEERPDAGGGGGGRDRAR
jgi:hypothetical protein